MKKSTLGLGLAAVILSCGLIFAIGQDQPREHGRHFLDLTPEQRTQLEKFREARRAENQAFRDQMSKLKEEWRTVRRDPQTDPKKFDGLIDEMTRLKADHWKGIYHNRAELRKIVTPEQLAKLDRFKERMRDRRAGRRHHSWSHRRHFRQEIWGEF
jgi:Spy/CpxP family protein refolding chaperone